MQRIAARKLRCERLESRMLLTVGTVVPLAPLPEVALAAVDRAPAEPAQITIGDANEDGHFDARDIVQVLQAGKYLTNHPATLAEGDWNGDGLFNQRDIVLALQGGHFDAPNVYGASTLHASGGGTYFVEPGVRSQFQLSQAHVQCKVAHAVFPDGTTFQMWMFSTAVDTATVDSAASTAVLTGTMVSIVALRVADGTAVTLEETVPFRAYAEDKGSPGAGADFFELTVSYTNTAGLDQFDLFGSPATFAGILESGNVVVH